MNGTRRRLLRAVAAVGLGTGLAGCSSDGGNSPTGTEAGTTEAATAAEATAATANATRTTPPATATGRSTTDATATADAGAGPGPAGSTTSGVPPETSTAETPAGTAARTGNTTATTGSTAGTRSNATERGEYTVGMHTDLYFDPIGLFVEPGETVSFEIVGGNHSATAYHPENPVYAGETAPRIPQDAPPWNTGTFGETGAFRNVTFETVGTHDYYCIPHKGVGMIGRIVVGEPGGPATEAPNADGELPDSARIVEEGAIPHETFATE
jgi:plastocyanin